MVCEKCGASVDDKSIYCENCGVYLVPPLYCASCGHKFINRYPFCMECGGPHSGMDDAVIINDQGEFVQAPREYVLRYLGIPADERQD